jgi:hypothetical protein
LGIGWVGNLATAVKPDRSPKYKKDVRRSRQAVGFSAFFAGLASRASAFWPGIAESEEQQ